MVPGGNATNERNEMFDVLKKNLIAAWVSFRAWWGVHTTVKVIVATVIGTVLLGNAVGFSEPVVVEKVVEVEKIVFVDRIVEVEVEVPVVVPEVEVVPEVVVEPEVEYELTVEDAKEVIYPAVIESTRYEVIGILEGLLEVESVDLYSYNPTTGTVTIEITPVFDYDEGVRDDAWKITRIFAGGLYGTDGAWLLDEPRFAPNLRVTISTATYETDGESMRWLADSMLSRSEWENTARVR